jgi:hypothetical protein
MKAAPAAVLALCASLAGCGGLPMGHRRALGRTAARDRHHDAARTARRGSSLVIRERFSVVLERMVLELRGVACLGLEEVTPDRKSLVASRSFGQAVETRRGLEEAVSVLDAYAAEYGKPQAEPNPTKPLRKWKRPSYWDESPF